MIQKIDFSSVAFRGSNITSKSMTDTINNEKVSNSDFYVDKNGAEAIKARNFVANPIDIKKPMSLDDYKNKLINAGLVEGKNFDVINSDENNGASIVIRNEKEEPIKMVHWFDDIKAEHYVGYEDYFYPTNKGDITLETYEYDKEGVLDKKTILYSNPDAHKNLFPENIDINTTAEEYLKYLDKNNIKYDVSKKNENGEIITRIEELSDNGKVNKYISFYEKTNGDKTIFCDSNPNNIGLMTHKANLIKDGNFYELEVSDRVKDKGLQNNIKY